MVSDTGRAVQASAAKAEARRIGPAHVYCIEYPEGVEKDMDMDSGVVPVHSSGDLVCSFGESEVAADGEVRNTHMAFAVAVRNTVIAEMAAKSTYNFQKVE